MRRETWNPHLAGTLIRNEVQWRPARTDEPTLWEMTIEDPRLTLGGHCDLGMAALYAAEVDHPRHHYRALFTHGIAPDEMYVGLLDLSHVHLAVGPIHTQAEADTWIPQLLATKALTKEVLLDPQEAIDLTRYLAHIRVLRVGEDA